MNIFKWKRNGSSFLVAAIIAVCMVGGLTACSVEEQKPSDNKNVEKYLVENKGCSIQLPEEYRDKITLLPADTLNPEMIVAVYQSAALEKLPEGDWSKGFLFDIVRHTPEEFEWYWPSRITPTDHFAMDANYYYSIEWPADDQSDQDENLRNEYDVLTGHADEILTWFITNNNLETYDHTAREQAEYKYPISQALFSVTLSDDSKYDIILSRPIRQDDSGIWCVERMVEEDGDVHIAMPETDLSAMQYYAQLQYEADAGKHPELLDAEAVGIAYLDAVWDYARQIEKSSIKYDSKYPSISELSFDSIDLNANPGVGVVLDYESENFIVCHGDFGLFGYDLEQKALVFTVDYIKTFGTKGSVQGSYLTGVWVSEDGQTIAFNNMDADHSEYGTSETFYIDVPTLTYSRGEFRPFKSNSSEDGTVKYIVTTGTIGTLKYYRDDKEWLLFE